MNKKIDIGEPKTPHSIRQICILEKIVTELKQYKKWKKDSKEYIENNLIICTEDGTYYHPRSFAKAFERIQSYAGIERYSVHDMRHTFATQLLSDGAYINEVAQTLGHIDSRVTLQNHAHILPNRRTEVAIRMNAILPL